MFQIANKGVLNLLYVEYEEYKNKYYEVQRKYDEILGEKEVLFVKTQPKAVKFDGEKVSGGSPVNAFDEYLIMKEKKNIDQRLKEVKSILDDRARLVELKEEELRASNNVQDKIYRYRYLDRFTIDKITRLVNYSRPQIFRILKTIRNNLK